jgi:hypothetical protein
MGTGQVLQPYLGLQPNYCPEWPRAGRQVHEFTLTERPATAPIELSGLTADEPFMRSFSFAVSDWTDRIGASRAILWTISHSSFKQWKQWTADGRLAYFAPNTFPAESDSSAERFVFDGWVPKYPLREARAERSDVGQCDAAAGHRGHPVPADRRLP